MKEAQKISLAEMTGKSEDGTINQFIDSEKPSDEISLKAIDELLNLEKLKTISRLKFDQVQIITKLYMYHTTFGDTFTLDLADLILQLQISTNGLGRRELVQLVQQRNGFIDEMMAQQKGSKGIFR